MASWVCLDISLLSTQDIHVKAWQLATRLNRPAAYDAHYLAGCRRKKNGTLISQINTDKRTIISVNLR